MVMILWGRTVMIVVIGTVTLAHMKLEIEFVVNVKRERGVAAIVLNLSYKIVKENAKNHSVMTAFAVLHVETMYVYVENVNMIAWTVIIVLATSQHLA
mmetsp:Transcript_6454/g.9467  ORF Transcript_6454/g.9467 Transcript_6454/m.9467 type:complete len:98 (-) Transcript_6454:19-312(-)